MSCKPEEDADEDPDVVSFWATRTQIKTFIKHAYEVVRAGRPICGNCGQPIDPMVISAPIEMGIAISTYDQDTWLRPISYDFAGWHD
jgi:hypothetical protein